METDYTGIYNKLNFSFLFAGGVVKLLVALILFAILFYSFMLVLKIRVLQDTVDVSPSGVAKVVIATNLLLTLAGSIIAFILILL
jgi:hypothetical protein